MTRQKSLLSFKDKLKRCIKKTEAMQQDEHTQIWLTILKRTLKKQEATMKTNYDKYYPDNYHRADGVQAYIESDLEDIKQTLEEARSNLDDRDYSDFIQQLKDMIGEEK